MKDTRHHDCEQGKSFIKETRILDRESLHIESLKRSHLLQGVYIGTGLRILDTTMRYTVSPRPSTPFQFLKFFPSRTNKSTRDLRWCWEEYSPSVSLKPDVVILYVTLFVHWPHYTIPVPYGSFPPFFNLIRFLLRGDQEISLGWYGWVNKIEECWRVKVFIFCYWNTEKFDETIWSNFVYPLIILLVWP